MTLPAPSLPDAPDPGLPVRRASRSPRREPPWPLSFVALVAVSALVVVLCVLGVTMSGLLGFLTSSSPATQQGPTLAGPTARTAVTSFDDGLWLVGVDLVAGTYATTVPTESPGCAWERNASTDGTASSVLESGVGQPDERLVVTIKPTDQVFQSRGCGLWTRTGD